MKNTEYIPKICVWELTLKCNMRCIHCGSSAGKSREKELTVDECIPIADNLIKLGCSQITFIGGEVFLYKGWEKIANKFFEAGADVNILTNAFFVGDAQINQIRYAGLSNVGISIDGMEANHDFIRNTRGSFKKALKAIERLNKENIPVAVVTSLIDLNFYDLEKMYDLLVDYQVPLWQIQIINGMGNMAERKDILLSPEKIPLITKFIREKRNEQKIRLYAGDDIGYYDENEMYIRNRPGTICIWSGCQAGLSVVGIDSIGNVKGCESIYSDDFIEGNLREESFEKIWFKKGNFSYNRNFDINQLTGKCFSCDKARFCRGGCRGSNYFSKGTLFENAYCCYNGGEKVNAKCVNCF